MSDIYLFAVTHKEEMNINISGYEKLLVGASRKNGDRIIISGYRDDIGDNISPKNNAYSELTGLYWLWKNFNCSILGLVHYRRFFVEKKRGIMYRGRYIFLNKANAYRILDKDDFKKILINTDIVVKQTEWRYKNNKKIFVELLGEELWTMLTNLIRNEYYEYYQYFKKVEYQHRHFNCNMFVAKKEIIDRYCNWLFSILMKMDQMEQEKKGVGYSNRELGYISEFLFKVWIYKEKLNYHIIPVVNIEDKYAVTGVMNLHEFIVFLKKKTAERYKKRNFF